MNATERMVWSIHDELTAAGRTAMKTKNTLTVSPTSGLSEIKRAESRIRLTQSVLGTPAPARNRTDEQGRMQGHWVERDVYDDDDVHEGAYVNHKRHGHWVERDADGGVQEGPYVDDKRHGQWIVRKPDGTEEKVNWRNGEVVE